MREQAHPSLIRDLKKILPPSSWPWIFPALRLDPLIWDSLNHFEQVFGVKALSEIIQHPDDCSPAALALKSLNYPRTPQELRTLPLIPIDPPFREPVEAAENNPINSLRDAALRALNLRQKRQSTGSWNDWASLLVTTPTTPLACLFGMIPDQVEYLQSLLPSQIEENGEEEAYQRVLKVILSNPAPLSVQIELITLLTHSLSLPERDLFRQALLTLQPTLATSIPQSKTQRVLSPLEDQKPFGSVEGVLNKLKSFTQQLPLSVKIFDRREPDLKTRQLTQSIQWTAQTQALMLTKLAILCEINANESEAVAHWQNALHLQPRSEILRALSVLNSISKSQTTQLFNEETITHIPETALLRFVYCIVEEEGEGSNPTPSENTNLINLAQAAIEELELAETTDPFLSDQEIQQCLLALLTALLIKKGFYSLAQRTIHRLLNQKPNHPTLLSVLALLLQVQGIHDQALELWHLLEGFHPQDERLNRLIAQSHAANSDWKGALQRWQNHPLSNPQSIYEVITCARFTGQESMAVEQCLAALKVSPQDGILLSLLAAVSYTHL
ncbi:MAG: hypothetical protein N3D16_04055, partial [Anaerolineales bacterium]|nr:hypothetical protein [Anaerolineales bacterium]